MLQVFVMFLVCICLAQANDSSEPPIHEQVNEIGSASSDKAPDKFNKKDEERQRQPKERIKLEKAYRRAEACQKGVFEGHIKQDSHDGGMGVPDTKANANDEVGPP